MKKLVSLLLVLTMLLSAAAFAELNTARFLAHPDNSLSDGSILFGVEDMMSRTNGTFGGLMLMIYSEIGYGGGLYPCIITMFGADGFVPISGKITTDTRVYSVMDWGDSMKAGLPPVDITTNTIVDKQTADMFRDMATSVDVQFTLMANGQTYEFELTPVQKGELLLIADCFDEEIWPLVDENSPQYVPGLAAQLKPAYPSIAVSEKSASAAEEGETYATLQKGSKGEDVKKMQTALKELGYLTGTADGDFGPGTEKAVKAFQSAEGMAATGIADHKTLEALYSK